MKSQTKIVIISALIILFCPVLSGTYINMIEPGHSETIPQSIDKEIQQLVEEGDLPSLDVVLLSENQIAWSQGFGDQEKENRHYQIGSVEKVLTAISILQLYEQGELDIYDDINNYLSFSVRHSGYPDIPITIEISQVQSSASI